MGLLYDIFINTYSELTTLNNEFNKLYKHYNTTEDSDELINNEEFFIENQVSDNSTIEYADSFELDFFTQQEIALFQQIYQINLIQNFMKYEKKSQMSEQDDQVFLTKIQQMACCNKKCFSTFINHNEALKRFSTTDYEECKKLTTSNYKFQGVSVCQKAWLTIYAIGKSKWKAIRTHYSKNDISPIVHSLKEC
ncbi:9646_t:CDS:2, partial [Cetraspora pellucida]